MGLYTKTDERIDKIYEITSINKSLSKQNCFLKHLVLLLFIFNEFVIIKRNI